MRLTLRTLLAYVDDILEPADHEELGKKIESSDFATELIHRSRDTVRRLRLGAPPVHAEDSQDVLGGDITVDANSVAEYLDNTLPPEQVADYERICLEPGTEADIHLAEVASCHHILTMVLGEPAEISAEVRERMYNLPQDLERRKTLRIESAHQPVAETPAAPQRIPIAPVSPSADAEEGEKEVPDYLRAATRQRHLRIRLVAAAVILAMVGGIGYLLWPVEERDLPDEIAQLDIADLGDGPEVVIETDAETAKVPGGSEAPPFQPETTTDVAEETTVEVDTAEATESTAGTELPAGTAETGSEPNAALVGTESPDAVVGLAVDPDSISASVTHPPATEDASPDVEVPTASDIVSIGKEAPLPTDSSMPVMPAADGDPNEKPAKALAVPPPPEPDGPMQAGNYLGDGSDVLLRRDIAKDAWVRLEPPASIFTGDQLLALPTFRPHVALADANLYITGGTHLSFLEDEESGDDAAVGIDVRFGRVVINAGLNGGFVKIVFGDQQRLIQLGGSAGLAVEVRRVFIPGSDFEREPAPIEVNWYLTSGSIEWPGQAGGRQTIEAPSQWKTLEGVDELPEPIANLPDWIEREQLTSTERRARDTLAEQLETGQSVGSTLLALTDKRLGGLGRRREVRTLAASCSLHLGYFEPFVQSLSDVDQSRAWEEHIDSLRTALSVSPEVAARVREAFENQRGTEATADLMEMVQGYSLEQIGLTPEDQQNGVLVKLLGWLDSDSLDYRVLAIYNLNEIAGVAPGSNLADYQPYADSRQRERSLRRLWQRFESNELLPSRP